MSDGAMKETLGYYAWTLALGESIRARRKARRLTLKDVAARAGICLGHLSQIERGDTPPSIDFLLGIATALEVKIVDLMPTWAP